MVNANTNEIIYRRPIRHRDVELYPIGVLRTYSITQFHVAYEIKHIGFSINDTWFNRKLLTLMVNKDDDKGDTLFCTFHYLHLAY